MYESPITKIYGQIQSEIIKQDEEYLMCSVNQSVGYRVDKDELIKALQYDRDQYRKGYNDALDKIRAEIEAKCDRINSLASVLPYTVHREIQELLCEIMDLCKESEGKEWN